MSSCAADLTMCTWTLVKLFLTLTFFTSDIIFYDVIIMMHCMCDQINTLINQRLGLIREMGKRKSLVHSDWCVDCAADGAAEMCGPVNTRLIDITRVCSRRVGLDFLGAVASSLIGVSMNAAPVDLTAGVLSFGGDCTEVHLDVLCDSWCLCLNF